MSVRKKIGIITHSVAANYGGALQAISLYCWLKNEGHEVVLIRKKQEIYGLKKFISPVLQRMPFQNIKGIRYRYIKSKKNRTYVHSTLITNYTEEVKATSELNDIVIRQGFDVVIVGSDQVWRYDYIGDKQYLSFFLDFVPEKIKKISYAASFGNDKWPRQDLVNEVSYFLQRFSSISVRESSGVDILRSTFGIDHGVHVADPTLIIGRDFFLEMSKNIKCPYKNSGGVLVYALDRAEEAESIASSVTKNFDEAHIFSVFDKFGKSSLSIGEWVNAFKRAEYVVTDSYHGMIFSIIFGKQFRVLVNSKRGASRFLSLLNVLRISDQVLIYDVSKVNLNYEIEYENVSRFLNEHVTKSKEFLKMAIDE